MTCRCGHLDGEHFDEVGVCSRCECERFRPPLSLVQRLSDAAGRADLAHDADLAALLRLAGGSLVAAEDYLDQCVADLQNVDIATMRGLLR